MNSCPVGELSIQQVTDGMQELNLTELGGISSPELLLKAKEIILNFPADFAQFFREGLELIMLFRKGDLVIANEFVEGCNKYYILFPYEYAKELLELLKLGL